MVPSLVVLAHLLLGELEDLAALEALLLALVDPGIPCLDGAGHQARAIRQFEYTAPPGAAVILHSDGISSRWEAGVLPGLNARDPLVVGAMLLAEAGTRRDDAGVLVLKP